MTNNTDRPRDIDAVALLLAQSLVTLPILALAYFGLEALGHEPGWWSLAGAVGFVLYVYEVTWRSKRGPELLGKAFGIIVWGGIGLFFFGGIIAAIIDIFVR